MIVIGEELDDNAVERLLRSVPKSGLLKVLSREGRMELHELRPVQTSLGEASPARVIEAIRSLAEGHEKGAG